jgi:SSS family solute:Na+ symporter
MFATFSVPLLAGLYWRRATRQGAIAAMVFGLGSALVFGGITYFKIAPLPVHFSLYGFFIALFAMVIVSLLTEPHSDDVLDTTMTGWYIQKRN